jgi:hypothetical protein
MTDQQIDQSIETNKLKLTAWGKFEHYGIVFFLFFIPIVPLFLYFKDLLNGNSKEINGGMLLFTIIPFILGLLFYRLQHNRLNFKIAETNLTRDELDKIIHQVSIELKWTIITSNKRIIEAKTFPSFFSGSWGEQITILFDNKRVLVNSICDLDKRSSVVSMGRNKKNTNRLIDEIEKASR